MNPTLESFVVLVASAVAVVLAGAALARSGDVIAARTRLGHVWVGSVFLAIGTSLPELTTDIAAIRLGEPDLAAGDLFGSSMANMLILAVLALRPGAELFQRAALDHGLGAALAIILTCVAALAILVDAPWTVLGVGPGSVVLVVVYLTGTRAVFRLSTVMQRAGVTPELSEAVAEQAGGEPPSLRRAVVGAVLAVLVIVVAAPVFAASAERIAELTGLGTTFVGTWLVGLSTSLPELVTSLAAVRIGAYDLAVGNLFGSNAINMVLLAVLDLVYAGRPFLSSIDPVHAVTALVGVVLMGIALAAVIYRVKGRDRVFEATSLIMFAVYALGLALVFLKGRAP